MTTRDETELVHALVELATLLRVFDAVRDAGGGYAEMQAQLVKARAIRWDQTGDVIEKLEQVRRKRLRR